MGDDQRRAVGRDLVEGGLNFPLGMGVERRSGFVEQQDARPLEDGAGDGNPLLFAARQFQAVLADAGFIAVGQTFYKSVDAGHAGGFFDLFAAGAGALQAAHRRQGE